MERSVRPGSGSRRSYLDRAAALASELRRELVLPKLLVKAPAGGSSKEVFAGFAGDESDWLDYSGFDRKRRAVSTPLWSIRVPSRCVWESVSSWGWAPVSPPCRPSGQPGLPERLWSAVFCEPFALH